GAHQLVVDDRLLEHVGALAAVLARPAHRDEARLVELPLPRLGRGDPLRLAVLDRAIVPPRARQVGGEPGAEAAAQRLVRGPDGGAVTWAPQRQELSSQSRSYWAAVPHSRATCW